VINGDQPYLTKYSYQHPVISFGKKTSNQIQARKIMYADNALVFHIKIYQQRFMVKLPTCNEARVMNALGAIAACYLLEIDPAILVQGAEQPLNIAGRFEILNSSSKAEMINDAYNANPESMKASLLAFDKYYTSKKKVIVLGDMLELGDHSMFWHRQLGRFMSKVKNIEELILIGNQVRWLHKTLPYGFKASYFESVDQAYGRLQNVILDQDRVILFKSSRSMGFIELIQKLQE
jgi:UDP-N-acetylmuramoyl-tripeptide--D-alanyl-D-alanine ligase